MQDNYNLQTDKIIRLKQAGKRYPPVKCAAGAKNNFEDYWALKDVSLDVYRGEILGIIGRNGAGKTTLLNTIAGVLSLTQGGLDIRGMVLGLFNLGVGFQDELTGRENIFLNGAILGASKKELRDKLDSIIAFSELGGFIDMPLGTYSQGMRLRLGFGIVVNLDFDILVIDEVLAVGDALFQSKCYQRLMDFKRCGKTLVITSQSMEFIERLCDKVALLEHGQLLFSGNTIEGIEKYRALLNTQKFFVGPSPRHADLVEDTKKWAQDTSGWGRELGTKEVVIRKVSLLNRFGIKCSRIKSGRRLKIKIDFSARNTIKEPHFGVAIFRNDGVYCYGPNTKFDGYKLAELKQGSGYFLLDYHRLLLAPGEYRISVAIWDKNETLAFNYREGYYKLIVNGNANLTNELLNMPLLCSPGNCKNSVRDTIDLSTLDDKWGEKIEHEAAKIESVKLSDSLAGEGCVFMTNDPVRLSVIFSSLNCDKDSLLWAGIYREDGIYCQGIIQEVGNNKIFKTGFPRLALLPGRYTISVGIWDKKGERFLTVHHAAYPFRMVFDRQDHGTVYLEHKWGWKLPV